MERIALFPGSFNPFTEGHADIVRRALGLFDKIVIAVAVNSSKPDAEEDVMRRVENIRRIVAGNPSVDVIAAEGLTVDAAREVGACAILRGVRSIADYEYERNLADINRDISGIETVLLPADPGLAHISSSVIRELKNYNYDVSRWLPDKI